MAVLHFHGTMDEYIPFMGGKGKKSVTGTNYCSVDHSIKTWVTANGCNEHPKIDQLSKVGEEMSVTRKTYCGGKDGTEVVQIVIEGGGHTWPGMKSPAMILGKSTKNISANDLMWEFFEKHPMK